jgi:hypothetical protein
MVTGKEKTRTGRLNKISNQLGFSICCPFSSERMKPYCYKGRGLRSLLKMDNYRCLIEVLTFVNGKLGRFVILVSLGIGCTVWYKFHPCGPLSPMGLIGVLNSFETYEPFSKLENYVQDG